jgi:rhamnogalacturonyl hydrolase YesR
MQQRLEQSILSLAHWIEAHDYEAYDPGDGELSFLRHLAFNHTLRRCLTASVLRAPFNIRPLIGIRPHRSTKGTAYIAWAYVKMYALTGKTRFRRNAEECFDWLLNHRSPGFVQYCWGNEFAFSTRAGTIPRHAPTVVWTSLIGQAFLEAHRVFNETKYLDIASNIASWIMTLPCEQTRNGLCLSYVAFKQSSIHNSNMLGAALLAQVGVLTGNSDALDVAKQAMLYSCSHLNSDGSWYYGADPKYHWIDNFHTGYNLDSLKRYAVATGDDSFNAHIQQGFEYFKRTFFEADGRPRYYHDRTYPSDIQCAAQAIDTLTFFSAEDPEALPLAQKVADWTIDHMQHSDGHFCYRDLGWKLNKTPMLHWGQGTMLKALSHLLSQLKTPCRMQKASEAAANTA